VQRGGGGWFQPEKYDYLLMSCQKPWHEPTSEQIVNVKKWYEDIQPNEGVHKFSAKTIHTVKRY
jgi:hypothetical protein